MCDWGFNLKSINHDILVSNNILLSKGHNVLSDLKLQMPEICICGTSIKLVAPSKNVYSKMPSAKYRPFRLGFKVFRRLMQHGKLSKIPLIPRTTQVYFPIHQYWNSRYDIQDAVNFGWNLQSPTQPWRSLWYSFSTGSVLRWCD